MLYLLVSEDTAGTMGCSFNGGLLLDDASGVSNEMINIVIVIPVLSWPIVLQYYL